MSHIDVLEKQKAQEANSDTPKGSSIWQHYKGDYYVVSGLTMYEPTEEFLVLYYPREKTLIYPWSRPLVEWTQMVEYQGKQVQRFTLVKQSVY
jgi:hypothetical protein